MHILNYFKIASVPKTKIVITSKSLILERVTGVEPVSQPWEGYIIPIYDTRAISPIDSLAIFASLARPWMALQLRLIPSGFDYADFYK